MSIHLRPILSKLVSAVSHRRMDREFEEEITEHIARLAERLERQGMSPQQAHYAAKCQFGGATQLKEWHRENRSLNWLEVPMRELQHSLRAMRRAPGFTSTIIFMLALGIGANSAIFTIADQLLFQLLPVKSPKQLVLVNDDGEFIGGSCRPCGNTFSYPAFKGLQNAASNVFSGIAARYQAPVDIGISGLGRRAQAEIVSGNYFDVLGTVPAIGRTLTPEDDKIKLVGPYAVLSFSYWQGRFGSSSEVLNQTIDINGHPFTIIGVTQKGFRGFDEMNPADVFVPMVMKPLITPTWDEMARRNSTWLRIFARLRSGVSNQTAQAALQLPFEAVLRDDLASVHRDRDFSGHYLKSRIVLQSAAKGFDNQSTILGRPILILWSMVGVLLLIACVNIASLTLARAAARQKEVAVRLALGASRLSLLRLALIESLVLAGLGGVTGLLLSSWLSGLLASFLPVESASALLRTLPDTRVLCFTVVLTVFTTLLFGLVPAIQGTRPDVAPTLKNALASLSFGGHINARRFMVFAQVTLSVLLLTSAGVFAGSLRNLMTVDTGIKRTNLLTFLVTPSRHNYSAQRAREYYIELQSRLDHIAGVTSASAASIPVLTGDNETATVHVEGFQPASDVDMTPRFNAVLPGFFTTLGVPLLRGRDFSERDTMGAPKTVMVNQAFAHRYVLSKNAVGLHLGYFGKGPMDYQIIGVVQNSKQSDIREPMQPSTYISVLQYPDAATLPDLNFYVRAAHDPSSVMQAIRRTVAQLDPSIPVSELTTLVLQIEDHHKIDRLFAWLSIAFAASAVLLSAIGLYALMSFLGARRRTEIGVRLALGAERFQVIRLMMREVWILAVPGILCGLLLATLLARFVQSQVFGIQPTDPTILTLAAVTILLVCVTAAYLPARRSTGFDLSVVLRYE